MVEKAWGYGYRHVGFILDRGYFSKENIQYMDKCGYDFVIMVKEMNFFVSDLILENKDFTKFYDGIFILFKTGLRISELCGLTIGDINFEKKTINVNKQLQYTGGKKAYIEMTKTDAGTRVLPMSDEVCDAFNRVICSRKKPKVERMIDGVSGFLFLDDKGKPMVAYQ